MRSGNAPRLLAKIYENPDAIGEKPLTGVNDDGESRLFSSVLARYSMPQTRKLTSETADVDFRSA